MQYCITLREDVTTTVFYFLLPSAGGGFYIFNFLLVIEKISSVQHSVSSFSDQHYFRGYYAH